MVEAGSTRNGIGSHQTPVGLLLYLAVEMFGIERSLKVPFVYQYDGTPAGPISYKPLDPVTNPGLLNLGGLEEWGGFAELATKCLDEPALFRMSKTEETSPPREV
jgi:hypothetical protein